MPRIRSLKPDHKSHRKIGPLSDREYRLWVGMLTEADDAGRLVADAGQLRLLVFGYHPRVRASQVEAAIQVLARSGLIALYKADGQRYAAFPSWADHQVINKPQRSKLPDPPHSGNGNGPIPEPLPERLGSVPGGSEGSGREGKGSEGEGAGGGARPEMAIANGVEPTNDQQDRAHHAIVAHVREREPREGLRDAVARDLEQDWVRDVRAGTVDPEADWTLPASAQAVDELSRKTAAAMSQRRHRGAA